MDRSASCAVSQPVVSDGRTEAALHGELDAACATATMTSLARLIRVDRPGLLVVDVGELAFLDAAGARALLATAELARLCGGRVELRGASGIVRRVLQIVGCPLLDEPERGPAPAELTMNGC
jgi:anti-anti-sigma factor